MTTIASAVKDDLRTFRPGLASKPKSLDLESGAKPVWCSTSGRDKLCTSVAYVWFGLCTYYVAQQFSDREYSAVLTLSAAVQCFGLILLVYKVRKTKSVFGLSRRSLESYVIFFLFRLGSTIFKDGYIPVDRSGDWVYQVMDVMSLLMCLQLLYCVIRTHRTTYQSELDTVETWRAVPACILLAVFVHGNLNANWFFDVIWHVSLNLDALCLLPQLYMLYQIGDRADALNMHYVAAIVASRTLAFMFWFRGYTQLAPRDGSFNAAGWNIIGSHGFQLLVASDFMLQYIRKAIKFTQVLDEM